MAIISFDKDTVVEYVPEFGGNRDSDDPCIVSLKFIPYSKVQHYAKMIQARTKGMKDITKVAEVSTIIQKKQFTESVEKISGYFVGDVAIVEPGEFYDTADTDLIVEILGAMENSQKLSEGQVKN